ncbi:MAG: DNA polymerase III subunit chi [Alphaproteobacteria bacterium]|jgi:DNA polymerase III subunit chi|nr:DNA polymerase III subunit chi [Alphaproteobacteria bacterium]MBT7942741.1 DNA polymerase III subunit chi [Alphaproteobacteria bacterium]
MTEIAFYHLQSVPLEQALPKLLEKTLAAGKRALVMASTEERVESLNGHLWTYAPNSWLPHGSANDGDAEDQPVWLSSDDANPNGAEFLFLTDGATSDRVADFDRCFEIFDGRDAAVVDAARARWKAYADAGHDLTYWRQNEGGGWEKKAT